MAIPPLPDFRSAAFLRQHLRDTMAFYDPVATDPSGGQFRFFLDDGMVYNPHTRHLVSATRFVVTHAMLYRTTGEARYQAGMRHAACAHVSADRISRPCHGRLCVAHRLAGWPRHHTRRHTTLLRHGLCDAGLCPRLPGRCA